MARPSKYTPKLGEEICRRLAEGESLLKICKDKHIPSRVSVHRWLFDEIEEGDPRLEFRGNYARARAVQSEHLFDDVMEISTNGKDVARDRLRVDTLKWVLARMDSRKYGDKTETTLKGDPDAPLQTQTTHKLEMTPAQKALTDEYVQNFVREGDD